MLITNLQLFAEGGEDTSTEASTATDTSANIDGGVAELHDDSNDSDSDTGESTAKADDDTATHQTKQNDEENSKYAKARRESENKLKEVEARAKTDREIAKKYGATYGVYSEEDIKNTFATSHGINNLAEFEARLKAEEYKAKGIDTDAINDIINNHPDVKKAQEQAKQAQAQENIRGAISQLNADYQLDLKTGDDLDKLHNADKMAEFIGKGLSASDAYFMANKKEILSGEMASAKQAAINSINSKNHIKATGDGVDISTVKIDAEEMKYYKAWFPKWSEKQIREYHAKQ